MFLMKKLIALLLALMVLITLFSGCSGGTSGKREINAPSDSNGEDNQGGAEPTPNQQGESPSSSNLPEGTIASLDELKERAKDAGYEIAEMEDIQVEMIGSLIGDALVDGFNLVMGSKLSLFLELASPDEAQAYADMINEGGYGAAIVNGRFVTSADAVKGIIEDPSLQAELEAIMDAKAQVQENWTNVEEISAATSDYKGAFELVDAISKSMNTLLDQSLTKNNLDGIFPLQFNSIPFAMTSTFCEDEAQLQAIVVVTEMLGMYDTQVTRNAAHDYSIIGKKSRNDEVYEIHGVYDPAVGSLRMIEKTEGEVTEFLEFVPLGNNLYALQTQKERGLITWQDNQLIAYRYTKLADKQEKYDSESDSIYPSGNGADAQWVAPLGEDGYAEFYHFENKAIRLNVDTFTGRVQTEIPAD
jgi:hypothetical protein